VRSESARTFKVSGADGAFFANIPQCTRKDLRNAVEAAAKAGPGWARRTPLQPGADPLPPRRDARGAQRRAGRLARAVRREGGGRGEGHGRRVDRLIHYAGWADKYEQLLGSVNPVASRALQLHGDRADGRRGRHRPGQPAAPRAPLDGRPRSSPAATRSSRSPPRSSPTRRSSWGDAGHERPAGRRRQPPDGLPQGARADVRDPRAHARGLRGGGDAEDEQGAQARRRRQRQARPLRGAEPGPEWFADSAQGLDAIRDFVELKTTWHPIGS
jgi:hypothetical protein